MLCFKRVSILKCSSLPFSTERLLFKWYMSYSYCYSALVSQICVLITSDVYIFTKDISNLPWRSVLFQWMNKSTGSLFFHRLHAHASKLSWTQDFWRSKAFLLLLQVFLGNHCFLNCRLDLLYIFWLYISILYRKTGCEILVVIYHGESQKYDNGSNSSNRQIGFSTFFFIGSHKQSNFLWKSFLARWICFLVQHSYFQLEDKCNACLYWSSINASF